LAPQIRIDPALIENFGRTMRENFSAGSVPFGLHPVPKTPS